MCSYYIIKIKPIVGFDADNTVVVQYIIKHNSILWPKGNECDLQNKGVSTECAVCFGSVTIYHSHCTGMKLYHIVV